MQPDRPSPSTTNVAHVNSYFNGASPAPEAQQSTKDSGATPLTPITEQPPQHVAPARPPSAPARSVAFRPLDRQQSAIQLRRLRPAALGSRLTPTMTHEPQTQAHDWEEDHATDVGRSGGRRRSSSEPQRPSMPRAIETVPPLSSVPESPSQSNAQQDGPPHTGRFHRALGRRRQTVLNPHQVSGGSGDDVYESRVVDFLDVIDPEVATLSSITNIQNSLFLPSLGKWVNRRPTYDLSQLPPMPGAFPPSKESIASAAAAVQGEQQGEHAGPRSPSLSSVLTSEPQYAILPNDASLQGWREEDVKLLNDYVRHMLHSRRSKIKQRFKAFGKYVRRPLGFLITLYATLITLFGLAWVLFLIGWVYVGDSEKQLYAIDIIDYVLVALFAIVGDGMAPFRAKDTYHMFFVARYHRKTWRRRERLALPELKDHNDLPIAEEHRIADDDLEAQQTQQRSSSTEKITQDKDEFVPVLSEKQQARLIHHQSKLAKSHTFFKPHETETHHAFPLRLLIAIVLLLDLHSLLQISLGAVTFGIPSHRRPVAATTTILCCSIVTNITAGLLITIGDRRTRKKDVLERLMRQEMTGEVIKKIEKKKEKERKQEEELKHEQETGEKPRKSLSLALPWKDTSGDEGTQTGHEKEKRARSLSVPRTKRKKEKEEVGRFSSEVESTQGGGSKGAQDTERLKMPGAFEED
ncbi:hypothetical protein QC764_611580 [Podospora pseudoanserina]|uniref:Integral membrane protein n=1 Tax=Podospora pseudoanserina TaxID=2609844 RepID=A0ABR0HRS2_9PEZI|nr:hypothetical protein QC764_611580 [Podospora pseudoanserina]